MVVKNMRERVAHEAVQSFVDHAGDMLENAPVSPTRREYIKAFMRAAIIRWNQKQKEST